MILISTSKGQVEGIQNLFLHHIIIFNIHWRMKLF